MPKRTAKQIRLDTMEEVRKLDEEKSKRRPPSPYKLPKVDLKHEVTCCVDKKRPLPEVFKPCIDCPRQPRRGPKTARRVTDRGRVAK